MKKINLMALAKPLEMVATVTGHLSGEEVSEHPLSLQRLGKGEIQYKEQEKRQ